MSVRLPTLFYSIPEPYNKPRSKDSNMVSKEHFIWWHLIPRSMCIWCIPWRKVPLKVCTSISFSYMYVCLWHCHPLLGRALELESHALRTCAGLFQWSSYKLNTSLLSAALSHILSVWPVTVCNVNYISYVCILWNLSNATTFGPEICSLIREVVSILGHIVEVMLDFTHSVQCRYLYNVVLIIIIQNYYNSFANS